jgi:16S rRNA (guanine966-N2)-methyltransferase
LLDEEGMMIMEHSKHTKLDHMMHFSFQKNYGGSVFSFYEFEGNYDEIDEDEETES